MKFIFFVFLTGKRSYNSDSRKVLIYHKSSFIKLFLYVFKHRNGFSHYKINYKSQDRRRNKENKRQFYRNSKSHYNRADYDKRRSQEKSEEHIYSCLSLIDIYSHTSYQSRASELVYFSMRQGVYMMIQIPPQLSSETQRSLGGKILSGKRAQQTQYAEKNQNPSHAYNIVFIRPCNSYVYYFCHNQRHSQLKAGLYQLEQRSDNALKLIVFQIFKQL